MIIGYLNNQDDPKGMSTNAIDVYFMKTENEELRISRRKSTQ